jgi:serine phosphatase RsbU (regulator of sigma subunit)/Tfp pilus assembly protein PilF
MNNRYGDKRMKNPFSFMLLLWCCFLSPAFFCNGGHNPKIENLLSRAKNIRHANVDSSVIYATNALALAEQSDDTYLKGKSMATLASSLRYQGGSTQKVIDLLQKSVIIFKNIHEKELLGRAYISLGLCFDDKADYQLALKYNFMALDVFNEFNFADGIQEVSNNIAVIYEDLDDPKNALKYYMQSLEFARRTKDAEAIGGAYANIGAYYIKNGDPALATSYLKQAIDLKKSVNDWAGVARITSNMGRMYYASGEVEKGVDCFKQSLAIKKKYKIYEDINSSYYNLGIIEEDRGNFKQAAAHYLDAYEWASKFDNLQGAISALGGMVNMYDTLGEYKKALNYSIEYIGLSDSLFSIEKSKQTLDMKEKYETDKKEKELLLQRAIATKNEAESKRKTTFIIAALGVLILVTGLLFMVYKTSRLKQKTNVELEQKNKLIEHQKELVEEKQKEIIDSINYAKRIQTALLAGDKLLSAHLPEHFVLFKPKDIVAGDFYWAAPTPEGFLYITADCTGHGVPGAFMSLLNISKLNETINQKHIFRPDLIFNDVRTEIVNALNPEGSTEESKDGMDAVLCKLDLPNMKLEFSGANNSFYIIRGTEILVCKADKMAVGKGHDDSALFTFNEIALQKGDMIFTFTDGYADQFGGPKGKKLKYKQMEDSMLFVAGLPMQEQKRILEQRFEEWKGSLEQVDDVLVIGVRV